jgi:hypothetical protein
MTVMGVQTMAMYESGQCHRNFRNGDHYILKVVRWAKCYPLPSEAFGMEQETGLVALPRLGITLHFSE